MFDAARPAARGNYFMPNPSPESRETFEQVRMRLKESQRKTEEGRRAYERLEKAVSDLSRETRVPLEELLKTITI